MILAKVGAFDSLYPNRRALETMLLERKEGLDVQCVSLRLDVVGPGGLPCVFDWENEPLPVNPKTGKTLKAKPLPKKCSKACRQYTPRPPKDFSAIEPYTAEDIRDIEQEMLGTYLSSTPFERFDEAERELLKEQAERASNGPTGYYTLGGVVTRINKRKDRTDSDFAFVDFTTEAVDISAVCFAKRWAVFKHDIKMGTLCVIEVEKTGRGFTLTDFIPVR
jgi:DNA polymerase III alpha subunit